MANYKSDTQYWSDKIQSINQSNQIINKSTSQLMNENEWMNGYMKERKKERMNE